MKTSPSASSASSIVCTSPRSSSNSARHSAISGSVLSGSFAFSHSVDSSSSATRASEGLFAARCFRTTPARGTCMVRMRKMQRAMNARAKRCTMYVAFVVASSRGASSARTTSSFMKTRVLPTTATFAPSQSTLPSSLASFGPARSRFSHARPGSLSAVPRICVAWSIAMHR